VWAGTFHRAKGLKFKRVYILGLDAPNWPPRVPGPEAAAQAEADARAVRAAFVGMTRARDSLDVVTTQQPAERLMQAAWAFDR
jgi:superfamily I DNA/RNA helicase